MNTSTWTAQFRVFSFVAGIDYITGENFLDMLDNGVIVCHLARVIQERAKQVVDMGSVKGVSSYHSLWQPAPHESRCSGNQDSEQPVPTIKGRCWENAARRSFFSRDNMENFIQFCRKLGVHQNLLFESDDLVLHNQPRNVILCLLEVSRLASRYNVEPPSLVQLEKEIAEEESQAHSHCHSDSGLSHSSLMSWQFQSSPAVTPRSSPDKIRHSRQGRRKGKLLFIVEEEQCSSSAISSGSISRWGRSAGGRPRSSERRSLLIEGSSGSGVMSPQRDLRRAASEGNTGPGATSGGASDGVPSDTTEDDWSRGSGEDPDLEIDQDLGQGEHTEITELDRRTTIRENTGILLEASKEIGLEVNPEKTKYMIMSCDENIVRNGNIKIGNLSFEEVEKFKYLGATVTNINDTRKEIKRRINMANACYYSVEKLLSSSLLSKNRKVRIHKTVILPVVLYGCETWTLTLREEQRLRVFENKVLRKMFGAKRDEVTGEWRKLHNTELHALYSSPDIIRNFKSRRLRWAGHVARMGESRNAYRVLVGRPEGKRPLGRPRRRWEDNIKMDLREVGYDDREWINLAQDRDQWRAYVRAAVNLWVQQVTKVAQRHCQCPPARCSKLKVRKVGEGRYNIAGRNVFIRLLKGRHMMVRVGGGWDTLEHFLLRHDPCQVKVVSRDSPTSKSSSPSYLHIQAKYRSPPPSDPIGR
ncbi:hypothetical protein ANN_02298 [Periplaneta americana]|uniref:Growth arrest-specific protein 2 n=1 Tax=Periplaneta americana TaxID=6978 RepID=A0ABQ8TVW6_PERAM|nr:hypothetical protein ANN_02298 [Periplaneta americana]